jgi:hypothetical protein
MRALALALPPTGKETRAGAPTGERPVISRYFFFTDTGPGTLDGVTTALDGTATGFFGCLGFLASRLLRS